MGTWNSHIWKGSLCRWQRKCRPDLFFLMSPTGFSSFCQFIRESLHPRKWQPTSVFFPGKFHGQRSPAGYSPWGCKELGTTAGLNSNNIPKKKWSWDSTQQNFVFFLPLIEKQYYLFCNTKKYIFCIDPFTELKNYYWQLLPRRANLMLSVWWQPQMKSAKSKTLQPISYNFSLF